MAGLGLVLTGACPDARADVTLPALIADNMVLQQKSTVALWPCASRGGPFPGPISTTAPAGLPRLSAPTVGG